MWTTVNAFHVPSSLGMKVSKLQFIVLEAESSKSTTQYSWNVETDFSIEYPATAKGKRRIFKDYNPRCMSLSALSGLLRELRTCQWQLGYLPARAKYRHR